MPPPRGNEKPRRVHQPPQGTCTPERLVMPARTNYAAPVGGVARAANTLALTA